MKPALRPRCQGQDPGPVRARSDWPRRGSQPAKRAHVCGRVRLTRISTRIALDLQGKVEPQQKLLSNWHGISTFHMKPWTLGVELGHVDVSSGYKCEFPDPIRAELRLGGGAFGDLHGLRSDDFAIEHGLETRR